MENRIERGKGQNERDGGIKHMENTGEIIALIKGLGGGSSGGRTIVRRGAGRDGQEA